MATVIGVGAAHAVGESVNGFPNWAERVIHEWINRARVDPQVEMDACDPTRCIERDCYGVMPPLSWNLALNRAARFHSDELVRQAYFAHTSACTVVPQIDSLYPASCDGSASCACTGGTATCSPTCTDFAARVRLFGGSPSGEIIASSSDPDVSFYLWLRERGDVTQCQFTQSNGHRWLILKSTGAVGMGVSGRSTGDFGSGSAPAKIPSGAHYPRQSATVQAWANWYDNAGPTQASVNVDGTCSAMTLQRGTQTNGAWSATLTGFGSGCHRYYFSFRDAAGATVTYPTTGSLAIGSGAACPDWDPARPAACAAGGSPIPSTATASMTASPTASPTRSLVPTATASRTATATATPTRTATQSVTPTPTATVVLSGESVSGSLRYYSNDAAVPGVGVHVAGATSATSDATGHYTLDNMPATNAVVYAEAVGGVGNAVSALDAAWVLQSVAGLRPLSPEQLLACDVTGNGALSPLDATRILQSTVGLLDRFAVATACDSDWAFIPIPAAAPDQTLIPPQPGTESCVPGGIAYGSVTGSLDEQNFHALVFGDCTGNWQPPAAGNAARAAATRPRAKIGELRPLRGGRMALPIAVNARTAVQALEASVSYDPLALRVVGIELVGAARAALLAVNRHQPGLLRLAMASGEAIASDGRPMIVIIFAAPTRRVAAPSVSLRLNP